MYILQTGGNKHPALSPRLNFPRDGARIERSAQEQAEETSRYSSDTAPYPKEPAPAPGRMETPTYRFRLISFKPPFPDNENNGRASSNTRPYTSAPQCTNVDDVDQGSSFAARAQAGHIVNGACVFRRLAGHCSGWQIAPAMNAQ